MERRHQRRRPVMPALDLLEGRQFLTAGVAGAAAVPPVAAGQPTAVTVSTDRTDYAGSGPVGVMLVQTDVGGQPVATSGLRNVDLIVTQNGREVYRHSDANPAPAAGSVSVLRPGQTQARGIAWNGRSSKDGSYVRGTVNIVGVVDGIASAPVQVDLGPRGLAGPIVPPGPISATVGSAGGQSVIAPVGVPAAAFHDPLALLRQARLQQLQQSAFRPLTSGGSLRGLRIAANGRMFAPAQHPFRRW